MGNAIFERFSDQPGFFGLDHDWPVYRGSGYDAAGCRPSRRLVWPNPDPYRPCPRAPEKEEVEVKI